MVELALTPDRRWVATTAELVAATADAGFSALGLPADRIDDSTADLYAASGLRCHEVLALVLDDDPTAMAAAADDLAGAAERIGAEWILTTCQVGLSDATTPIVERCAAVWSDVGAGMAVEFTPMRAITSMHGAREVVEVARRGGRAGVLIDTWHFSVCGSTWDELAAIPLDDIAYVQFSDGVALRSDDLFAETMDRRELPGDGELALDRFATTLRERGWDGLVSVEVLNAALLGQPVDQVVRLAADTTRPYWH